MNKTRPESHQGSKPDPSEWLTVAEAVRFHYEHTPRDRPIHRSAIYRYVHDPGHPVRGCCFGGEIYIERKSLKAFCCNGHPRRGRVQASALSPSEEKRGVTARQRILAGTRRPEAKGGRGA